MSELFSIVIPTYNSRTYSPECVQSSLGQTYSNVEVIVDDNASTDGTGKILRERFGQDPRFRLFERVEDLNMPLGWNRGIAEARGEYIMLLHSDNILHPTFAETIVSHLKQYKANVAYTDCLYFTGETPKDLFQTVESEPSAPTCDVLSAGTRTVAYVFRFERMIPISTVVFRRHTLDGNPAFDPRYEWDPDMALLVKLANKYGILHVKRALGAMRTHPDQAPNWKSRTFATQYDELLWLQHIVGKTERHHYLAHRSAATQDICQRLSTIKSPPRAILKFLGRWVLCESITFQYYFVQYLRRNKLILTTFFRWAKRQWQLARQRPTTTLLSQSQPQE